MDSKLLIVIAAVVAVIVIGVVVVTTLGNNNGSDDPVSEGIVYIGNGGVDDKGNTKIGMTDETVIPNLFTYKDHTFINWNTKADGTGKSYNPGETMKYGTKAYLYAQWTDVTIDFSSSFHSGGPYFDYDVFLSNGAKVVELDPNPIPLTWKSPMIMIAVDGHDWKYDNTNGSFIGYGEQNGKSYEYKLTLTLNGATGMTCNVIDNKLDAMFEYTGSVHVSISTSSKLI